MAEWLTELAHDPRPLLLKTDSASIRYFTERDLLRRRVPPVDSIWSEAKAQRILDKQLPDGRWKYPGGGNSRIRSTEDYDQLETFRELGFLVEKFGFTKQHQSIRWAAEFMFSHQTGEGDFRGIYGRQYTPNYSAGIMELLIKAGYAGDPRIEGGFDWLLSMRQSDGGWVIPLRTIEGHVNLTQAMNMEPVLPDRSKPSSHLATGMVLRAFAADEKRRSSTEARAAGELLTGRFFKRDHYPDRSDPDYWWGVSFPFWFTDIVSVLDSLSLIGFAPDNPGVADALARLKARQRGDGSFKVNLLRTGGEDLDRWVCLAICRVFRRLYS